MRKLALFFAGALLCSIQLLAQSTTVTGRVTDAKDGSGLADVSVSAIGTNIGVRTDADGNYTITFPSTVKTLTFSFVGYGSVNRAIGKLLTLDVQLSQDESRLDEVVVVGYGTQKRKEITGSIASVAGAEVANRPIQSFEQALGGRAAGVQITIPNGVLNNPPVIRVRGTNSVSLSSQPLIVIDGIPVFTGDASGTDAAGNALASINPNDIESIDIAKDAAASAIYGSRAANGVIFVTTKKGKSGKAKVTLDSWVGFSKVWRLPELMDAFQYTDYKNLALQNQGTFNAQTNAFALTNGPDGSPINTNWFDYVYRTGIQHSHTVNVSGANDATRYYFSAGFTDQEGIIQRNDFRRISILANIDTRVGKMFSIGGKIQYANELNEAATSSGSIPGAAFATAGLGRVPLVTAPNVAPRNNDGTFNTSGQLIGVMGNRVGQVGFFNPTIAMEQNRSNAENNRMLGNMYLQMTPAKGVTLRSQYSIDYLFTENEIYASPQSGEGFGSNGSATSSFVNRKNWVWTNTAQYDLSLMEKHNFSLLGGLEQQRVTASSFGLNRIQVNDPDFRNIQGGWATPNTAGLGIGENYLLSQFGRLNYNFENKYFISGNLRRDGASQLGANTKYGTFWGISAGWEIAREAFWENSKLANIFSSLKARASYGKVGNIGGLGDFASLSTFGSGLYGQTGTLVFNQVGNPNLGWESSKKLDIGINFGFMNDRITGELTYYNNDVDGLILNVPAPPSAGMPTNVPTNVGTMYNRGLEFGINADVIRKAKFSWNSSFNFNWNENEVTSLAPGLERVLEATSGLETVNITLPGHPVGSLYVTRTNGVDPATGRRIFVNSQGQNVFYSFRPTAAGNNYEFADGTRAPNVSSADAVVYANTNPRFVGGWDNTLRYGNFELNTLFTYQAGFSVYFGSRAGLFDQRFWNNSVEVLNHWARPGDVTSVPKPFFGDNVSNGSAYPLDINVFKGDFIRLRTLQLTYNLPTSMLSKANISSARFYVAGNNVFLITGYPGPDPEVSSNGTGTRGQGVDRNTVGNARTLTVGLNVGF
jgi:TonB-linked SusC/RagA family outer membrane protein